MTAPEDLPHRVWANSAVTRATRFVVVDAPMLTIFRDRSVTIDLRKSNGDITKVVMAA